jgi:hypothetical protein
MADADDDDGAERASATAEEASGVTPDVVERLASEAPLREYVAIHTLEMCCTRPSMHALTALSSACRLLRVHPHPYPPPRQPVDVMPPFALTTSTHVASLHLHIPHASDVVVVRVHTCTF